MNNAIRLLENSGFRVLSADGGKILLEDPSCIARAFETFAEYAWIAITALTFLFLAGWAIAMIRGTKPEVWTNLRNLTYIFGVLSATPLIVNVVYGGDVFANACKTIGVDQAELQKLLDARKLTMKARGGDLYEDFDIWDTGPGDVTVDSAEVPYSESPIYGAGEPEQISVTTESPLSGSPAQSASVTAGSGRNKTITYVRADGTKYTKTGGSAAWRNNNPGNIEYKDFAKRNGAIGTDGRFAIFPDEATGERVIVALLQGKSYKNLTLSDAIKKYAPPVENNVANYRASVSKDTGIPLTRTMGSLSDAEMASVVKAIRKKEGWDQGTIGQ